MLGLGSMTPHEYWKNAEQIGRSVFGQRALANVDEQAGPAYFEGMALSRWIFWRRLKLALGDASAIRGKVALDFGCGFGLALPQLREQFALTVGVDLVPELSQEFLRRWDSTVGGAAERCRIVGSLGDAALTPGSVDLILALDVLEHFESLREILGQLSTLLAPSGTLIVSGPTENVMYRLGRKLVGFSGAYHHQTMYQVIDAMSEYFDVRVTHRFPAPAPLFLICSATKKS